MAKDLKSRLQHRFREAIEAIEFLSWDCGEQSVVMGCMRALGVRTGKQAALLIESFEDSRPDGYIRSSIHAIASYPLANWLYAGNGIWLDTNHLSFGPLEVAARGQSYQIDYQRETAIQQGYLPADSTTPSSQSLMLTIRDSVPAEALYSSFEHIMAGFALEENARLVYSVERWHHPSFEELFGEETQAVGALNDIDELLAAVAEERAPQLKGIPNNRWEDQCR